MCCFGEGDGLGRHQTGHNNCVIHTGIYYRTGSLKAINCVRGARLLKAFCDENGVDYEDCGKVIVATNPEESRPWRNCTAAARPTAYLAWRLSAPKG